MEFGKYLSVIVTPFNPDNTINYDAILKVANYMIDGGVEGLIIAATGGESATMSLEERIALTKFMKKEVGNRVPIIVGTGTNNTAASIETTKAIEAAGGRVARGHVDAKAGDAEKAAFVRDVRAQGANIQFTWLEGDSVLLPGAEIFPAVHHMSTWKWAYLFEGVREWLFEQHL